MPTSAHIPSSATVLAYYRGVQGTLLTHVRGRSVFGFGRDSVGTPAADTGPHHVRLHIADAADIDEAVRSGIVGFRLPGLTGPGMVAMQVRPGDGSGIDTVATAALALAESMAQDGLAATVLTDGANGLYLIAVAVGPVPPWADADHYARDLATRAPEIATTDALDVDGRALVESAADAGPGLPAPYSLIAVGDGMGVVAPLTLDEVAAASAGMPLEIQAADVAGRILEYGDLAAAVGEATARSA